MRKNLCTSFAKYFQIYFIKLSLLYSFNYCSSSLWLFRIIFISWLKMAAATSRETIKHFWLHYKAGFMNGIPALIPLQQSYIKCMYFFYLYIIYTFIHIHNVNMIFLWEFKFVERVFIRLMCKSIYRNNDTCIHWWIFYVYD